MSGDLTVAVMAQMEVAGGTVPLLDRAATTAVIDPASPALEVLPAL
jgi:hypothetical protein